LKFPLPPDELTLHNRVLSRDPIAPMDVFQKLMEPLRATICHDLSCTEDEAYDSAVDAILAYIEEPERFDKNRARLSTYITDIAKKRAIDRLRSRTAAQRRAEDYTEAVELRTTNPKEVMENEVEARELWQWVEKMVPKERDRRVLKLILAGERSTAVLAEALDINGLSPIEQRREVKQHRDRLMKILERLGVRLRHDDGA